MIESASMHLLKPSRLRKGDLIGLVSPAGIPIPAEKVEKSVRYLESAGYRVKIGQHVLARWGYLAGTDEQRASDFNNMIHDSEVKAIFATRGGYGSPRLLPLIDYGALRRTPKIVSGFSDITGLQLAIYRKCGLVTFSGPMPAVEFWQGPDPYTEENFWRLLTSAKKPAPLKNPEGTDRQVLRDGTSEGPLLGGNLSLVVSALGTPWFPSVRGALLVLEEVEEAPYRVDRMLTQIAHATRRAKPAAVIFGQFTGCEAKDPTKPHFTIAEVLTDFAKRMDLPVWSNLQYGHVPRKLTLPFGVRTCMKNGVLELLEAAVSP